MKSSTWVISFACLHWVIDHRPVLRGNLSSIVARGANPIAVRWKRQRCRGRSGRIRSDCPAIVGRLLRRFHVPLGLLLPGGVPTRGWRRRALRSHVWHWAPKDMTHEGRKGLEGWLRTTWMPYWQRVPAELQQQFFDEIVDEYLKTHPIDSQWTGTSAYGSFRGRGGCGTDVRATIKDAVKTVGNLIDHATVSIIGSVDEAGFPNAKAMLPPRKRVGIKQIYFTTNLSSMRVKQYAANPKACVYFCDKRFYRGVMLRGTMKVLKDSKSKKMIWRDGDELYYKKGVTDPDYCVIKFTAKTPGSIATSSPRTSRIRQGRLCASIGTPKESPWRASTFRFAR